ncbi:hypothetical protein BGZ94_004665 [Podila epigama]|nr:hypothetical protein BGZ94_004665 [Podila epigama]
MRFKSTVLLVAALMLMTRANGALFDNILAQGQQPPGATVPGATSTDAPTVLPPTPTIPTPTVPVIPTPSNNATLTVPPTSSSAVPTPVVPNPTGQPVDPPKKSSITTTVTTAATKNPSPTPAENKSDKSGSTSQLATAGIVVASVVVAAAIGIWVFRKWKLSPSRDFQSKIRGDDYTDYPRNYENDTVYLRNLDQAPEPIKSPYNNAASLPSEDQYYDPNYAAKDQGGYGQGSVGGGGGGYGHNDYNQGYDHHGGYGHSDYASSQVGGPGGYGHGHSDYAPSQVGGYNQGGYNQGGGYAPSNVGGGYQHGYDDYGRR